MSEGESDDDEDEVPLADRKRRRTCSRDSEDSSDDVEDVEDATIPDGWVVIEDYAQPQPSNQVLFWTILAGQKVAAWHRFVVAKQAGEGSATRQGPIHP